MQAPGPEFESGPGAVQPAPGRAARGIMFSAPMVAALLAGTKTQTRRALRPQPGDGTDLQSLRNPFGQPGDLLWVRERFIAFGHWQTRWNTAKGREEWFFTDMTRAAGHAWRYEVDDPGDKPGAGGARITDSDMHAARIAGAAPAWHRRPALFMPRAASRILLEIVAVRAERLQAVSAADALAEGVVRGGDPIPAYRAVWEGINGAGSWDADPVVWMVEFRTCIPPTPGPPVPAYPPCW